MKFFAADNYYASDTDKGFVNTWYVRVFDSRKARDAWVDAHDSTYARKAITRKEALSTYARSYDNEGWPHGPRPFTGEFWGIREEYCWVDEKIQGSIGILEVMSGQDAITATRLNG